MPVWAAGLVWVPHKGSERELTLMLRTFATSYTCPHPALTGKWGHYLHISLTHIHAVENIKVAHTWSSAVLVASSTCSTVLSLSRWSLGGTWTGVWDIGAAPHTTASCTSLSSSFMCWNISNACEGNINHTLTGFSKQIMHNTCTQFQKVYKHLLMTDSCATHHSFFSSLRSGRAILLFFFVLHESGFLQCSLLLGSQTIVLLRSRVQLLVLLAIFLDHVTSTHMLTVKAVYS